MRCERTDLMIFFLITLHPKKESEAFISVP
jgi:hypothetical protein